MRSSFVVPALFVLAAAEAWAGVVIEMEVKRPDTGDKPAVETIYAEGTNLRIDPGNDAGKTTALFRDETMWLLSHEKKSGHKITKGDMEQLGSQISGMMKQMEAELSKLPPDQRAMAERVMKGALAAKMAGAGGPSGPQRIEAGAPERVGAYSCTPHTLYSGEEKVWEVCAGQGDLPAAATEAIQALRAMSEFTAELQEVLRQGPFSGMVDTSYSAMSEVSGFPVRVRAFQGGKIWSESTLKSIASKDLDDAMFSVPVDYEVTSLADMMKEPR